MPHPGLDASSHNCDLPHMVVSVFAVWP